jgi:RNA polymerase sigma-70 factor (ECF subfamily)
MNAPLSQEFDRFYRQHAREVLAFLAARVQPAADAADVAQEAWLRAWNALGRFDGRNFRAWLFEIARNAAIDHNRRHRPETLAELADRPDGKAQPPEAGLIDEDERQRLARCLERLSASQRELVRGRLGGESYETLCGRLGLGRSEAYKHYFEATRQLQECVAASGP